MKSRLTALFRRIALSRRFEPLMAALSRPYRLSRNGTNVVVGDYYGMLVGKTFADDDAAARHYFEEGWRLGVIPTPFVHVAGARFSTAVSLLVRNEFARIARGSEPRGRWIGSPSRLAGPSVTRDDSGVRGGWLAALTQRSRERPNAVSVAIGGGNVKWPAFLASCRELRAGTEIVVAAGLIDLPLYESQVGGSRFLSIYAALDDYVARGEGDGRTVSPFFESEWYQTFDRTQVRRGRPANQFLDFVARGEHAQASPHWWGARYREQLPVGVAPRSLLEHFLAHASPDSPTPVAEDVEPASRATVERTVRERINAYHVGLGLRSAEGPILARHARANGRLHEDATCLVVVDQRHLRTPASVTALAGAVEQTLRGVRFVIVESDDVARSAELDRLIDETVVIDLIARQADETLGAVVRRLLLQHPPVAWTSWTPEQSWSPDYLRVVVSALIERPDASAAAVVSPATPQPWLRTTDATWIDGLHGAGVVFRAGGAHQLLPDPTTDLGLAWALLIPLAAAGRSVVVEAPLLDIVPAPEIPPHERRASANAARAVSIVQYPAEAKPGTGVVMPTYDDWFMTLTAVRRVLATTGPDVRIVVVDNGSRRPVATLLASAFAASPRVLVHRVPINTDFATGSNLGAAIAGTRHIVFLNNDTAVLDGWLEPLTEALDDDTIAGVQPLLLYGDRTVQTAGTIFLGGMSMPQHLFADVHPEDIGTVADDYGFSALTAACLAVRLEDLATTRGFDPHYINGMEDVDFSLRLVHTTGRSLRVRTDSRVVHFESRTAGRAAHHVSNRQRFAQRWRGELATTLDDRAIFDSGPLALDSVRWQQQAASPLWVPSTVLRPRPIAVVNEAEPRLRWAIKSSATGNLSGDSWGDTFFADSLAQALRRLGQHVVVDRSSSHGRASASWDDVTLALRGLARYVPQPGAINLLWVISHPDLVTRYELESGFSAVYSAGALWAEQVRERWGVDARVMLQATDTTMFRPDAADGAAREGLVFVGRTRGVPRQIVSDVIAAGGEPDLYGDDGWEEFVDPRFVKGSGIPNERVPFAYASAGFVLNDHWRDMAEFGFFSNRLFDAAAAGARIISDAVPGMDEVFGDQVRTYDSIEDLRTILDPTSAGWPSDTALEESAAAIARDHSFDARARTLLDDVLRIRDRKDTP